MEIVQDTIPLTQTVDAFADIEFRAVFKNVHTIEWYKDDEPRPEFNDQSTLLIVRARAVDQGYYYAIGTGFDGVSFASRMATLYLNGIFKL